MLKNLSTKNYFCFRQIKREFVKKTITFVNIIKKLKYDAKYKIYFKLIVDDYALCFYNNYIISNFTNRKFNQQRINFFKILKKIDTLVYRFELSSIIKIHSIIFITQLKLSLTFDADFYRCSRSNQKNSSSIQIKNNNESKNSIKFYEIENLLNKRISFIDRVTYLIK